MNAIILFDTRVSNELDCFLWEDTKKDTIKNIEALMEKRDKNFLVIKERANLWGGGRTGARIIHITELEEKVFEGIKKFEDYSLQVDDRDNELTLHLYHHDGTNYRTFHMVHKFLEEAFDNEDSRFYADELAEMYSNDVINRKIDKYVAAGIKWRDIERLER